MPTSANTDNTKHVSIMTSRRRMTDCSSASTIVLRPLKLNVFELEKFYNKICCHLDHLPGTIATVFKALNTLRVRRTDILPKFLMSIVAYLLKLSETNDWNLIWQKKRLGRFKNINYADKMTMKSSQFQASRRNENWSSMKPRARILSDASNVYTTVNTYLFGDELSENLRETKTKYK
jgi:hypothetical protein